MLTEAEFEELKILVLRKRAAEIKTSLFEFVKEFWDIIITDPYDHNWHIEYLCDEVQLLIDKYVFFRDPHIQADKWYDGMLDDIKKNLIVNIPPGTTKSTIISRMAPAWVWANDAGKTILSNTIDGGNASEFSTKSRDIIQSDRYQMYFPEVQIRRDVSAKTFYSSTVGGTRYSFTTKGSKTGKHGHLLIDDDPMNYNVAQSPLETKGCIDGFKEYQTRKKSKENTPYILVMQRLSSRDTTHHALKSFGENARHICLPAEDIHDNINPPQLRQYYVDGLLDPKKLSRKILMEQRLGLSDDSKPISDIAYNIQFNQVSQTDNSLMYTLNKVPALPDLRDGAIRLSFTDVADTGADYLATWFLEINQGKIYVFDAIYTPEGSRVTSEKLAQKITFHESVINKIETNNQGSVFVTHMQSKGINVSGYISSGGKQERISAYSHFIRHLYFVEPGTQAYHTQEYTAAVKHLESFPNQGKHDDGHDDAEDAITEAIRYIYTNMRHLFRFE